jgi:hypothetical protein
MGFAVDIVQRAGSCVTGTYAGGPSTSWESIQERAQYDNNLIGECDNIALAALPYPTGENFIGAYTKLIVCKQLLIDGCREHSQDESKDHVFREGYKRT